MQDLFSGFFLGSLVLIMTAVVVLTLMDTGQQPLLVDHVQQRSVEQYCASATHPEVCLDYLNKYFTGVYAP